MGLQHAVLVEYEEDERLARDLSLAYRGLQNLQIGK